MTEIHGFLGDATNLRYYSQIRWLPFVRDIMTDGYVNGVGDALAVSAQTPEDLAVDVGSGDGRVAGNRYSSSATVPLTIEAAHATLDRIDRIVLRNDITGARKTTLVVLKGTAAGSPSAPTPVRTADMWDLVLADVAVAAGVTSIVAGNITDRRADTTLCGVATPRAVRYSNIIVDGTLDANGIEIYGVTLPSADQHACTLAYRAANGLADPIGTIDAFPATTPPTGYLECNGAAISRSTYADLFAAIGTSFGVGDGSTTFNLPDLRGKSIFGKDATQTDFDTLGETGGTKTHTLITAELPAHTHTVSENNPIGGAGGIYSDQGALQNYNTGYAGGGEAHDNLPPYIVLKFIIKAVS